LLVDAGQAAIWHQDARYAICPAPTFKPTKFGDWRLKGGQYSARQAGRSGRRLGHAARAFILNLPGHVSDKVQLSGDVVGLSEGERFP
jgi:hypothetical protein